MSQMLSSLFISETGAETYIKFIGLVISVILANAVMNFLKSTFEVPKWLQSCPLFWMLINIPVSWYLNFISSDLVFAFCIIGFEGIFNHLHLQPVDISLWFWNVWNVCIKRSCVRRANFSALLKNVFHLDIKEGLMCAAKSFILSGAITLLTKWRPNYE